MDYFNLREANVARDIEWTGGRPVSFTFRGAELSGECGEVAELFIRHPSEGEGPTGMEEWLGDLGEEIADGLICVDLVGMKLGFPSIPHETEILPEMVKSYGALPVPSLLALLGARCGKVCNALKKMERTAEGWVGSKADPADAWPPLFEVHCILRELSRRYGFESEYAGTAAIVSGKFNRTSEKYKLATRYYV